MRRKTGTREWAESSFNIARGCIHNCRYCYARATALRFRQIKHPADWTREQIAWPKNLPPKERTVMFPTTHDITPYNLSECLTAIAKLIANGCKVLIVSKPHIPCIEAIMTQFSPFKDRILFRFTIGTINEATAKFWEPGAPSIHERLHCLRYAWSGGWDTSVSMEPMLAGVQDAIGTFEKVAPHVTDRVWIGKMRGIERRIDQSSPEVWAKCREIMNLQSDSEILDLVARLDGNPKVAWKDSIQEVFKKYVVFKTKAA